MASESQRPIANIRQRTGAGDPRVDNTALASRNTEVVSIRSTGQHHGRAIHSQITTRQIADGTIAPQDLGIAGRGTHRITQLHRGQVHVGPVGQAERGIIGQVIRASGRRH